MRTENQVLREKLGKKRILLSDDQRRRLGVNGKILGRKRLEEIGTTEKLPMAAPECTKPQTPRTSSALSVAQ